MNPIKGLKNAEPEGAKEGHQVYQGADQAPFRCDHCEYFTVPNQCVHPKIIKLRKGIVEPAACCDFFEKDDE